MLIFIVLIHGSVYILERKLINNGFNFTFLDTRIKILFSAITFIYPKFLSLKTLPLDFLEDTKCIIIHIKNQVIR